jgi:beta-lactamase class A
MNNNEKTIEMQITGIKVLAAVIILALWGGSLWFACKISEKKVLSRHNTEEESQYPLLNPRLRNFEKDERLNRTFPTLIPLRDKLFEFIGENKEHTAFYVEDLNGGAWTGWNEKEEFMPASILKVPIAMAAMGKVEDGSWTMQREFVIKEDYKNPGFGDLWKAEAGTKISLEKLIEEMIQKSDDTALNMLSNSMTSEERDSVYDHIGLGDPEEIDPKNPKAISYKNLSARNLATIFRALYNSTYLTRESSSYLLEVLSNTKFDETISKIIPPDVKMAHKIAAFDDPSLSAVKNYHDCGIAFVPDHPYLYCFMTRDLDAKEARQVMSGLSGITYDHFAKKGSDKR